VYEARNALRIAQLQGAEKYAANAWASAQQARAQMEDYIARKQADEAAQKSAAEAAQAVEAQRQLRAQLLAQLNSVLQTVDTPRGLVVTMADILFATGKYELSQPANLALAKLSGVILAHPAFVSKDCRLHR
jgi:outer membrane protein OmpA-like peptidoglycan-associated protein